MMLSMSDREVALLERFCTCKALQVTQLQC